MVDRSRRARGLRTQKLVAEYHVNSGFTGAYALEGASGGKDVRGMPGLSCEVKATSDEKLLAAIRQAIKNGEPGDLPYVVWRPNGYGEERMDQWVVALPLWYFMGLLQEAGYCDRTDEP